MQAVANSAQLFNPSYAQSPAAREDEYVICRNDLAAFIEKAFKIVNPGVPYKHNWHIEAIAEYLMACSRREIKRLVINIPPRSLKSISCSVAWPAWLLGIDPTTKILCASYSQILSTKHSVDSRLLLQSDWYKECFPRTRIVDDVNQKTKFITHGRGQRVATSVGSTVTGEGGNFLILDDPMNAMEAQSKTVRESTLAWFDQTWMSRLNDKQNDVMLVIEQRLHTKDISGHVLASGGWEHLMLPAIFDKPKTISIGTFTKHLKAGDILHPERDSAKVLDALKAQMGSYAFAGQYMQVPVPDGGGIFKRSWLKLYPAVKALPNFECIIQSYDTALTESTTADYTAFTAWGIFSLGEGKGYGTLLLDAWMERLDYPKLRKKVKLEYETRYGEGEGRRADFVVVEEKGSGISLIQDMQRARVPIRKYNPGRADKVQRAHLVTYLLEAGVVYVPESDKFKGKPYSWAEEVIEQLVTFPNAEHDDFVDSVTQALRLLRDTSWLKVKDDPEDEDIEDHDELVNPYGV